VSLEIVKTAERDGGEDKEDGEGELEKNIFRY